MVPANYPPPREQLKDITQALAAAVAHKIEFQMSLYSYKTRSTVHALRTEYADLLWQWIQPLVGNWRTRVRDLANVAETGHSLALEKLRDEITAFAASLHEPCTDHKESWVLSNALHVLERQGIPLAVELLATIARLCSFNDASQAARMLANVGDQPALDLLIDAYNRHQGGDRSAITPSIETLALRLGVWVARDERNALVVRPS